LRRQKMRIGRLWLRIPRLKRLRSKAR